MSKQRLIELTIVCVVLCWGMYQHSACGGKMAYVCTRNRTVIEIERSPNIRYKVSSHRPLAACWHQWLYSNCIYSTTDYHIILHHSDKWRLLLYKTNDFQYVLFSGQDSMLVVYVLVNSSFVRLLGHYSNWLSSKKPPCVSTIRIVPLSRL